MKKFIIFLVATILVVSSGFAVYYLVKDDEVMSISHTSMYMETGDKININLNVIKPNNGTTIEVLSTNKDVVEVSDSKLDVKGEQVYASVTAKEGGVARINFKTSNSSFRNLYCDIIVGDGSQENPFLISNAKQLTQIGGYYDSEGTLVSDAYGLDKYYEVVNDIDLLTLEDHKYWQPITNATGDSFNGSFNGNGYTISNLHIDKDSQGETNLKALGLFKSLGSSAIVNNLNIDNFVVNGESMIAKTRIGSIAGDNFGKISNCSVTNISLQLNSNDDLLIGGLVGSHNSTLSAGILKQGRIERCYTQLAKVEYVETSQQVYIGGLVAYNYGGMIINNYTFGQIEVQDKINFGGIVCVNEYIKNENNIENTYSKDICSIVKDNYTYMTISEAAGAFNYAGSVIGLNLNKGDMTNLIIGNYYNNENSTLKGIDKNDDSWDIGTAATQTISGIVLTDFNFDYETIGGATQQGSDMNDKEFVVEGLNTAQMKDLTNFKSYQDTNYKFVTGVLVPEAGETFYWNTSIWKLNNSVNNGLPYIDITVADVADNLPSTQTTASSNKITNATELRDMEYDGAYIIVADINIDFEWKSIGTKETPFQGRLEVAQNGEGKNYVITGLDAKQTNGNNEDYSGLFGYVGEYAQISGLNIVSANVFNDKYVGVVAGYNEGQIIDCQVTNANVTGKQYVGGIAGYNTGIIGGCSVIGQEQNSNTTIKLDTKSTGYIGGIAGYNNATITKSVNNYTQVKDFVNIMTSNTTDNKVYVGGVAGYNAGEINLSNVILDKTAKIYADDTKISNVGGIAGASQGFITNSSVAANIYGTSKTIGSVTAIDKQTNVGGIVGYMDANNGKNAKINIYKCKVIDGSMISGYNAGGIVGYMTTKETFTTSKASATTGNSIYNINKNWVQKYYSDYSHGNSYQFGSEKTEKNMIINIAGCQVSGTNLSGSYTGGFAGYVKYGVITDCYVIASFTGSNNAGFVYTLNYEENGTDVGKGGIIFRCYGVFDFKNGTSWQQSNSNTNANNDNNNAGFIYETLYNFTGSAKRKSFVAHGIFGFLQTFKDADYSNYSLDTMKGKDIWNKYEFNKANAVTGDNFWIINSASLPTLNIN